ncbi:hypothetical protein [Labilibacter marinus]|uniref:hypothetical protein n=1 Tax=Labilibacter marinus TaxID=1477105 RepID=UPI00082FDAE5|nr:hypothetical protein [Labilibacter marinus]
MSHIPYSTGLIPLMIDAEQVIDNHTMMRCLYFSVQFKDPLNDWNIELDEINYPCIMLHLEAIITGINTFTCAKDIDEMYNSIEGNGQLMLGIDDVWVPKSWFGISAPIRQGDIYRVSPKMFSMCWSFRNDRISMSSLFMRAEMELAKSDSMFMAFSVQETALFKEWSSKQIDESRMIYLEQIQE